MNVYKTSIEDLFIIQNNALTDKRGFFSRLFCIDELAGIIDKRQIVQINHSYTKKRGVLRGMHYQLPPHSEMKFIRCLRGRVFDVAVDLRQESKTFLHWHGEELSSKNMRMMVLPERFAHGFQVLEPDTELIYMHTEFYSKDAEAGVRWDDPAISIDWPLNVSIISEKDRSYVHLPNDFEGIAK